MKRTTVWKFAVTLVLVSCVRSPLQGQEALTELVPIRWKRQSPKKVKRQLDLETFHRNSFGAYSKALKQDKYTAIFFDTDLNVFGRNLIRNLRDPSLAKFSDRMIISVTDGDYDKGARQLEEALAVIRYPTIVVLKTNDRNIHVAGRIEGEVPVSELDRVFAEATKDPIKQRVSKPKPE